MQLKLPDDILRRAEANQEDLRLALAVQLYADNRIDYTDALKLAGVSHDVLTRELLSRALSVQSYPLPKARRRARRQAV